MTKNKILSIILSLTSISFSLPIYAAAPQLAAPSNLTATAVSQTEINLSWTDTTTNETGFKVERSSNGITFSEIATTAVDTPTYVDTGLQSSTAYYYRVRTYKVQGTKIRYSNYSNVSSATTLTPPPSTPAAPTDLTATLGISTGTSTPVTLHWTDNSDNETRFTLQRSTDGITFNTFRFPSANSTTAEDLVANGATYYYRVRADNSAGSSAYSNTATVVVP